MTPLDTSTSYELIRTLTVTFAFVMLLKYTFFLVVAPFHAVKEAWRRLRIAKKGYGFAREPLVSVLIPAWNEEVGLINTVRSIMENSYPAIEIVVVDDGSTDRTADVAQEFLQGEYRQYRTDRKTMRYVRQENGGKGKALNAAIEHSTGAIVLTVDADSIAAPEMIASLVRYYEDPSVDAVVGNVKVAGQVTFLNLLQRLEYLFGFYHKRAHSVLNAEYIFGGACASFRRLTVMDMIGVFDAESITEDIEMSMRARYHGLNAVYAHDAVCYTEGASSIMGLIKQRLRWKRGRLEVFRKYRGLFFSTNLRHNRWLSWMILPSALFAELQLLFEPFGLTLLILFSVVTGDYSSILLGAAFIGIMYLVVGLLTERAKNWWIVLLWPVTWAMFYALVWIEFIALMKSIITIMRAETVTWQRWQRKGITITFDEQPLTAKAGR